MDRTQACGACDASSILAERINFKRERMLQFLKQIIGLLFIVFLGYTLYHLAKQNADDSLKTLRVSADSTATIVGKVLSNKTDCSEQAGKSSKCFLTMRVGEKDITVIYNTNDKGFCINEKTAADGKTVRANATIKVYGFYKKEGVTETIFTCPSAKYFIQTL